MGFYSTRTKVASVYHQHPILRPSVIWSSRLYVFVLAACCAAYIVFGPSLKAVPTHSAIATSLKLAQSAEASFYPRPIMYANDKRFFGMGDPEVQDLIATTALPWGEWPRVLKPIKPRSLRSAGVPIGMHKKLDVAAPDNVGHFNPSLAAIPASSPLRSLAAFVGVTRAGADQCHRPNDVEGNVDVSAGTIVVGDRVERPEDYCEVHLLDNQLNILASTMVVPEVPNRYFDCRVMYLGRNDSLYIYTVSQFQSPEVLPMDEIREWWDFKYLTGLRRLRLSVISTESRRHLSLEARAESLNSSTSIALSRAVLPSPPAPCPSAVSAKPPIPSARSSPISASESPILASPAIAADGRPARGPPRPLEGKNHVFFESKGTLYVINRMFPLEVFEVVDQGHVRPAEVDKSTERALRGFGKHHLDGGKAVWIPELGEFLIGSHRFLYYNSVAGEWGNHYLHLFFTISASPPFRIKRLSSEFCLQSLAREGDCDGIQFIPQLERVGPALILPYGINDCEAAVLTVSIEEVLGMLRPLTEDEASHGLPTAAP